MNDKIYYHSGQFYGLRNYPNEPIYERFDYYIRTCIDSRNRIDNNYAEIEDICWRNDKRIDNPIWTKWNWRAIILKDGDIFDLPDGMMFYEKESNIGVTDDGSNYITETILRLVPKPTEKEDIYNEENDIHCEIANLAIDSIVIDNGSNFDGFKSDNFIKYLRENFTIKRKQS